MIPGYPTPRWVVIAALAAVCAVLVGVAAVWYDQQLDAAEKRGADQVRGQYAAAAKAQQDRNLDLQRAAEKRYTVQTETRERVITRTITEVRHAAEPLAVCPVPVDVVRLLNSAARCASGADPAACGVGEPVPVAR